MRDSCSSNTRGSIMYSSTPRGSRVRSHDHRHKRNPLRIPSLLILDHKNSKSTRFSGSKPLDFELTEIRTPELELNNMRRFKATASGAGVEVNQCRLLLHDHAAHHWFGCVWQGYERMRGNAGMRVSAGRGTSGRTPQICRGKVFVVRAEREARNSARSALLASLCSQLDCSSSD